MKYDYICENCKRPFLDSDRIIRAHCWHEECSKIKAQCIPRHTLNYPHLIDEFKLISNKLDEELPL